MTRVKIVHVPFPGRQKEASVEETNFLLIDKTSENCLWNVPQGTFNGYTVIIFSPQQ